MSIFPEDMNAYEFDIIRGQAKEYAWDFEKDRFIWENGKIKIVREDEAVKVWIYKALRTMRCAHLCYTSDFGNELESIIGSTLNREAFDSEAKRLITEALMIHPDIDNVYDFTIVHNGEEVSIDFYVDTVYGVIEFGGAW